MSLKSTLMWTVHSMVFWVFLEVSVWHLMKTAQSCWTSWKFPVTLHCSTCYPITVSSAAQAMPHSCIRLGSKYGGLWRSGQEKVYKHVLSKVESTVMCSDSKGFGSSHKCCTVQLRYGLGLCSAAALWPWALQCGVSSAHCALHVLSHWTDPATLARAPWLRLCCDLQ